MHLKRIPKVKNILQRKSKNICRAYLFQLANIFEEIMKRTRELILTDNSSFFPIFLTFEPERVLLSVLFDT